MSSYPPPPSNEPKTEAEVQNILQQGADELTFLLGRDKILKDQEERLHAVYVKMAQDFPGSEKTKHADLDLEAKRKERADIANQIQNRLEQNWKDIRRFKMLQVKEQKESEALDLKKGVNLEIAASGADVNLPSEQDCKLLN